MSTFRVSHFLFSLRKIENRQSFCVGDALSDLRLATLLKFKVSSLSDLIEKDLVPVCRFDDMSSFCLRFSLLLILPSSPTEYHDGRPVFQRQWRVGSGSSLIFI